MDSINLLSHDFVNEIKEKINIVDWISENQKLVVQGKNYRGTCPFCKLKNPTFTVFPETKSFYCFSCAMGGDIITYLMKTNDIAYPKAVELIAKKVGISMDSTTNASKNQLMKQAAEFYHLQLRSNPKAKEAIEMLHSWGLHGQQIVNLGLGFNDDGFRTFLSHMQKKYGYSAEMLGKHHLLMRSDKGTYYDKMRNSVIIPIINSNKHVVAFDYYALTNNTYYRYPNTDIFNRSEYLYSYNLAIQSSHKSVILVSTYDDYFALYSKGISNVVCALGLKLSESQLQLLKKHFKVILLLTRPEYHTSLCSSFCQNNNMYSERIELKEARTVDDYIENNIQDIKNLIDKYDNILSN